MPLEQWPGGNLSQGWLESVLREAAFLLGEELDLLRQRSKSQRQPGKQACHLWLPLITKVSRAPSTPLDPQLGRDPEWGEFSNLAVSCLKAVVLGPL